MRYILNERYALRGWEKLPWAVADSRTGQTHFISAQEMDALKLCNFVPKQTRFNKSKFKEEKHMKKFLFIALLLCLMACVAVASAEGLILKDAEGNVLEKGATLSGHYYYKVYVEGVPEEYEGIQTAWMRDVLDAEDHDEWEAIRYLHEDEIGRYILIVPVVGAEYIQETMFARLDENDTNITQINFTYDRETVKETDPPTLISEDDPKVGEENYLLQWNPVEGAEFYEVLWYTPSENVFYYSVTDPEFPLSEIEGALDEAGTYTLYILPYGDGMPFTYGAWTSEVTE